MRCITGHRVDYDGAGFLRGQQYICSKNWPKNSPTPDLSGNCAISVRIWIQCNNMKLSLLSGFNGSVFLSELFGCHCFTNVCVVSFQTIWFFKWFWQQIHLFCYVWSHFQHMPEYVFTTKKWNFSDACMTQLDGCRVSGHTLATWFWISWVFVCFILLCFSHC